MDKDKTEWEILCEKFTAFVDYSIKRIGNDSAYRAALRRADIPALQDRSYRYLSRYCDISKDWEFLPYAIVGAAIATIRPSTNGWHSIGSAIASCYARDNIRGCEVEAAIARIRRILSCNSITELRPILKRILSLIQSKGKNLDYVRLLQDLRNYNYQYETVNRGWAADFYGRGSNDSNEI